MGELLGQAFSTANCYALIIKVHCQVTVVSDCVPQLAESCLHYFVTEVSRFTLINLTTKK